MKVLKKKDNHEINALIKSSIDTTLTYFGGPIYYFYKNLREKLKNKTDQRVKAFLEFLYKDKYLELRQELFENESFVIGLGISFEKYIRLRSEKKRIIAKQIFRSFSKKYSDQDFVLERYYEVLVLISLNALKYLSLTQIDIFSSEREELFRKSKNFTQQNYQNIENIVPHTSVIRSLHKKDKEGFTFGLEEQYEIENELFSIGILIPPVKNGFTFGGPPAYKLSQFGKDFVKFLGSSD